MFQYSQYQRPHNKLRVLAQQVLAGELLWPWPLIGVGLLRLTEPWLVGLAVGLALLPWLVRWLVWDRLSRPPYIGGALALLAASTPMGVWASYDTELSWPLLWTLLGSITLFFAFVNTSLSPGWLARGLVSAASLLALYFVGQYNHFNYLDEVGTLADLGRLTGSFLPDFVFFTPHPNAAAAFMESSLLLSLALAWRARGGERLAWSATTTLLAYGLLISGSRGAWLGLAVALGLWILLLIPQRPVRWLLAGVGLIGVVFGVYSLAQMLRSAGTQPQNAFLDTAMSRLTLYRNSLYLLGDYPFTGIGLGDTFGLVYSRYQLLIQVPFLTYSHNLLLSVGLGLGILGLVALLWLWFSFYRFVIRVETRGLNSRTRPLFRAAWLGVTVTFVHGLTDAPQFAGAGWTMPMLFGMLGLAVAAGRLAFGEDGEDFVVASPFYRRLGWWVSSGVGAVLLISALVFWRPLLAAWYSNLGALHQTRAELSPHLTGSGRELAAEQAVAAFARALSLDPEQRVANRRLGQMALDRENFETATVYLNRAYPQEPYNQATLKALGYAYLWTGQMDLAEEALRQLDDRGELIEALGNWHTWWTSQNQSVLAGYAAEMTRRLSSQP